MASRRYSIDAVFRATDKASQPVTRMGKNIRRVTNSITRNIHSVSRASDIVVRKLVSVGKAVAVAFSAAVVAAPAALAVSINKVTKSADELIKRADILDFPIEQLQQWNFVAEQSGVSQDSLGSSLEALNRRLGDLKQGTGSLVGVLQRVSPELGNQLLAAENTADAFGLLVNAIRDFEDPAIKAAVAGAAFGRGASTGILKIAQNTTEEIDALTKAMIENGIITEEQARASSQYRDAVNNLKSSLAGLLHGVVFPLIGPLTEMLKIFREWVIANREIIQSRVLETLREIKPAVLSVFEAFKRLNEEQDIFSRFISLIDFVARGIVFLVNNAKTIAIAVGSVIALSVAIKALTLVIAALNLIAGLSHFKLFLLGFNLLIGAIVLVVKHWDFLKQVIFNFFSVVGNFVGEQVFQLVRSLVGPFESVLDFFNDLWDGILSIFDFGFDRVMSVFDKIKGVASFFGIGGGAEAAVDVNNNNTTNVQAAAQQALVIGPEERLTRSIQERINETRSEVTIFDQTNRAQVTGEPLPSNVQLIQSGAF